MPNKEKTTVNQNPAEANAGKAEIVTITQTTYGPLRESVSTLGDNVTIRSEKPLAGSSEITTKTIYSPEVAREINEVTNAVRSKNPTFGWSDADLPPDAEKAVRDFRQAIDDAAKNGAFEKPEVQQIHQKADSAKWQL